MSRKYPLLYDKAWLTQKYVEERLNTYKISELVGCSPASVLNSLKRLEIPRRTRTEATIRHQQLWDKEWLERKYLYEGLSGIEIAEEVGCSPTSAQVALTRYKIPMRSPGEGHVKPKELLDKAWLEDKYIVKHLSSVEIGNILGRDKYAVICALERYGISRRNRVESQLKHAKLRDKELLESLYIAEKRCSREIGERLGCSGTAVLDALKRHGIPVRHWYEAKNQDSKYLELNSKEWLYQKYCVEKLSSTKIADIVGCEPLTVLKHLAKQDVPRRTVSEAVKHHLKTQSQSRSRTNIEVLLGLIFNKYTDCIEYTGDGTFWITTPEVNINPDFIIRDKKIAIEANGDFWHSPLINWSINKCAVVTNRAEYLKAVGWHLVVFWGTDIERKDADAFVLSVLRKEGIV